MLSKHLIARTAPMACPENILRWKNRRVTLLTETLFRVEEDERELFCDDATQAVWFRNMPPVPHTVEEAGERCVIRTAAVTLVLTDSLPASYIVFPDGRKAMLDNADNLMGTYRTLDCCDGDLCYALADGPAKGKTIRLETGVVARGGAAVYDDSGALLLLADGTVAPRPHAESDCYIFAYGDDYRAAVRALYMICGAPPVIPRYALGNWWSRYWVYTQQSYLALMDSFADRGLPFTVATIDMDWHPSDNLPDGEDGWTGYTWNKELFPDHRAFLKALRERNMHITLNLHPALGVRWFEEQYEAMAKRLGVDPATKAPITFDVTSDDFINAYLEVLHHPFEADGVDFWWIDWQQGVKSAVPGLDPLWSLNHYHMLDISREQPGLILSRYAGIGSHRYPIGFSGDTYVTWKTLQYLPGFTATASNAGYTWWSHDIGGHMGGYKDSELFVRFVQFGVFSPINRLHSSKIRTLSKDIAAHPGGPGLIAREFLRLRHIMIPFLYTAACETTERGLALIEPMYYEYPQSPAAYECPGQYLFGRQMIAAPITCQGDADGLAAARVWLPDGVWTDFFTGGAYQGGCWQTMTRPLDAFPLLLKEGGFFVLDGADPARGNHAGIPAALDVHITAGSGAYDLLEDDRGFRAVTHFVSTQLSETRQTVAIIRDDPHGILPDREMILRFRSVMDGRVSVTVDGAPAEARVRQEENYTLVRLRPGSACEVTITETATPRQRRDEAITRLMTQAAGDYEAKEALLDRLLTAATPEAYLDELAAATILQPGTLAQLREVVGR